ncbi:potassium-transporting ATPase subunit C [Allokutzneria oryzae]|uniref:Potassium-transporting ATPase subunit C n=1 Tax=Allokutzneria oryzae TaxID=1378989 RepID=A0ABV6A809_9PSEU
MTPVWTGLPQLVLAAVYRRFGDYTARVCTSDKHWRAERAIYRVVRVNPDAEQRWTTYAAGVLGFSFVSVVLLYLLPLSLGRPAVEPGTAFTTAVSFVTNTNWLSARAEGPVVTVDGVPVGLELIGIDLVAAVEERGGLAAAREGVDPARVPVEAVTASASGLDPHVSPGYARLQVPSVARENGLNPVQVTALVKQNTSGGVIGEPVVNVLKLNIAVQATRR